MIVNTWKNIFHVFIFHFRIFCSSMIFLYIEICTKRSKHFISFFVICFTKSEKKSSMFSFSRWNHTMSRWTISWKIFFKIIRKLNKNIILDINENQKKICSFVMTFINDMFQQTKNEKFSHYNIQKKCRSCFCFKKSRENLKFDTIHNEKYHLKIFRQRQHVEQLIDKNQKIFLKKIELRLKFFVIVRFVFVLNLIQTRSYDAFHSKWKKLNRVFHNFLVINMFFKKNNEKYFKIFQNFFYSSG